MAVTGNRHGSERGTGKKEVDWKRVYQILKEVIDREAIISYRELSDAYEDRTGQRIHWRNWAPVLDVLGDWSKREGLPSIAAVVVNGQRRMPGDRFFGRSKLPRNALRSKWQKVLARVYHADWPETMSGAGRTGE
jgi:hypothetical protein